MSLAWSGNNRDRAEANDPRGGGTRGVAQSVLAMVCVLVLGIYAWCADSGVTELVSSRPECTYYNLLVKGFRAGQVNLKREVPPGLVRLANPHDPLANAPYRWMADGPLHDTSYYHGKLYLYFGVTPALLLFWPWTALTGHYLLHKHAVLIFCAVGFLTSAALLRALWRRYFPQIGIGAVAAGTLALGLATGMPILLSRSDVYEVPIACGYALTMLALAAIWKALHSERRQCCWLAAASLAYGLAVGARPSLLPGAVILLVPVAQCWRAPSRQGWWNRLWVPLLAAAGSVALIGMGLMLYNCLRFDSPFDFGLRHQLALYEAETTQYLSPRYLWFNFRAYFLQPVSWSAHFPFVEHVSMLGLPDGHFGVEDYLGGVLTGMPFVWLALCAPLAFRGRSAERGSALGPVLTVVTLLCVTAVLTLGLFFGAQTRYAVEFLPTLVLLAVVGVFSLERVLASRRLLLAVRLGWTLLLAGSISFNWLASVKHHAETQFLFGEFLRQSGRTDEAMARFQRALQIQPAFAEAHIALANALLGKGRVDEAISHLQSAVQVPGSSAEAHNALADVLIARGRVDEAKPHLLQALEVPPGFAQAHNNLGLILLRDGQIQEAIAHFQRALAIQPNNAPAHRHLAQAFVLVADTSEAVQHYQAALAIQPDDVPTLNNLAWILATCPQASIRNGAEAVELAQQANHLSGGTNASILGTLAAAYAEAGRFPEAVSTAQRGLELAISQTNTPNVNDLRARIKLYQTGSPLRDLGP